MLYLLSNTVENENVGVEDNPTDPHHNQVEGAHHKHLQLLVVIA